MIEEYERLLDCKNHLRDNLNVFIDAFVEFYGEEYRKEIEEKFSKAIFFAYREPTTTQIYLRKLSELISNEIWQQQVKEYGFKTITQEDLMRNYNMEFEHSLPIFQFKNFLELYEKGPQVREEEYIEDSYLGFKKYLPDMTREEYERIIRTKQIPEKYSKLPKFLIDNFKYYMDLSNVDRQFNRFFDDSQELLHKINPNITIDNFSYYLDNEELGILCDLAHNYDEIKNNYDDRMYKYIKYQEEVKIENKLSDNIRQKYYVLLMEENKDILTEDEIRILEQIKEDSTKTYLLTSRMRKLFGYGIKSNHILDSFSEESDEKLNNPETNEWQKKSIIQERIEYFKSCGIDLHKDDMDEYEEYDLLINNPEVRQLWPKKSQVNKFIESRDKLINAYNIEYYEKQPAHIEMRKEVDALGLLDKDDPINATLYTGPQPKTMVTTNIAKTKTSFDLFSIIMINCNYNDGSIDHNIVHELNHQFELYLKSASEQEYIGICGWDELYGEINQDKQDTINTLAAPEDKRRYELMNEIVNELIAQDICTHLKHHVFDTDKNAKIKHVTSYEETFYIIKDFYNEFKKEILESRKNGNIEIILNKVGKENFDALNELFNIHYENFSGFRYLSLVSDLNNKKETERTRIYHDIVEKRDKILEQMRLYSMQEEKEEDKEKTGVK